MILKITDHITKAIEQLQQITMTFGLVPGFDGLD